MDVGGLIAGSDGIEGFETSSGGSKGTKVILNFRVGVGGVSIGGSTGALTSSCTGNSGKKAKFGLRRGGTWCCGVGMGDGRGVMVVGRVIEVGGFIGIVGGTRALGDCAGSAGVAVDDVLDDWGALDAGVSCDGGRRGSRRIGTESRYGKISGSTVERESSRFFHLEGVREGAAAKREMGNGGFDCDGGEMERGILVEVNGWRELDEGARGSDFMISLSSRISLISEYSQL